MINFNSNLFSDPLLYKINIPIMNTVNNRTEMETTMVNTATKLSVKENFSIER